MRLVLIGNLTFWLTCFVQCAAATAQDWTQWRGEHSNGEVRSNALDKGNLALQVSWKRDIGAGYSNVAVVGNRVITMCSDHTDDFLIALETTEGAEMWRVKIGPTLQGKHGSEDGPSSSPCVVDGVAIAFGPQGDLVAVEVESGKELWRRDLVLEIDAQAPWYGFGSSPLRCGKLIYLPVSTSSGANGIAFDAKDGTIAWSANGPTVDYQSAWWIKASNELLVVDSRSLSLLDADSGEQKASVLHTLRETSLAQPQITPVATDEILLTYEDRAALFSFDQQSDTLIRQKWSSRELRNSYSPPVVYNDAIYGMCGTFLVCVDLPTGKRLWKTRSPGARSLTLVGDELLLFSSQG